ncbi:3'(2'),5'-bisphosphate nucleotidase CysQ [Bradyrhizobium sp. STM 3809]|uniref:3'(2'),5'-bisphosphate nucleotidase CysQ n=1 Tax=Bradyrhizobium sp. STM 3809 TaxID=551936 RepID=UPI0002409EFA|nr:3'(2'),5'-bisphosphate nucleotidase CysQ [Bradyrhizobium sp. STM 3809]CCE03481.1 CysQ protein [Bradyrhizobium sp. STM 3809]
MTGQTAETIGAEAAAALMTPLTALVVQAAHAILAVNRRAMAITDKSDGSPVTEADLAADRVIAEGLAQLAPKIPALSEERVGSCTAPFKGSFFLIDPLDGTKEFLAGRGEFTVNLALVSDASPLLGIVCAPAIGLIWRGVVGRGAERLSFTDAGLSAAVPIRTRPMPKPGEPWVAAVSRSHGDARSEAFIAARPGAERLALGSAVKFGRLAEGLADIYPRLGPTSEWDVAAGHAVVVAAGGTVTSEAGRPLRYGERSDSFIVPSFVAWGDPGAVTAV